MGLVDDIANAIANVVDPGIGQVVGNKKKGSKTTPGPAFDTPISGPSSPPLTSSPIDGPPKPVGPPAPGPDIPQAGDPSGPDPSKNLPQIVRDELQKEYPGAQITDQMVQYVVQQLNTKGLTAANTSAPKYRQAVSQLVGGTPWAQQQNPFSGSQQGQLTAQQAKQLLDVTDAYQGKYMQAMQNTEAQAGAYLKQLMPSLPKGYQDLVKAQFEGPAGVLNLDQQVGQLLAQQNPAAIANAYSNLYAGTGTTAAANNLFNLTQQNAGTTTVTPPKTG